MPHGNVDNITFFSIACQFSKYKRKFNDSINYIATVSRWEKHLGLYVHHAVRSRAFKNDNNALLISGIKTSNKF